MRSVDRINRLKVGYQHDLEPDDIDPFNRVDMALARTIADRIDHWYPAHRWAVNVSHATGIVKISIPELMGEANCYVLHIEQLKTDPGLKSVMRAGGELLERYKIPRAGFSAAEFAHALRTYVPLGRVGPNTDVPT